SAKRCSVWLLRAPELRKSACRFVKRAVRAFAQDERHLGATVREKVIDVAELVVAGGEPLLVRLHAHQGTDVLRVIDVPGGGVAVLLAREPGRHRIKIAALPE